MEYGLQLYSVNSRFNLDPDEALRRVAEMGYDYVEFCTYADRSMEEIKALLEKHKLGAIGTHQPIELLMDDAIENTIKDLKTLGLDKFIIPIVRIPYKEAIEIINKAQPILEANGISLHYHNHASEFSPAEDGVIPYFAYVDQTNVNFEVDILYVSVSGYDPLEFIKKLGKRVTLIHFKDGDAKAPYNATDFGKGEIDIPAIHKYAVENGIPMICEPGPRCVEEIYPLATSAINYMRSLDK